MMTGIVSGITPASIRVNRLFLRMPSMQGRSGHAPAVESLFAKFEFAPDREAFALATTIPQTTM